MHDLQHRHFEECPGGRNVQNMNVVRNVTQNCN